MAEVFAFSLASRLVADIISPPVIKAYEKGVSIWEAKEELAKLQMSVDTIHVVLLDAETKQEGSAAVANWIKRVKGVLYDAEDLFDEVVTKDLIKKHRQVSLRKKVHVSCFKLNPIVSRNSISKKVKAIRKKLADIATDMADFQFVRCLDDKPMNILRKEKYIGCSTDENFVIGRDEDKKVILDMLISEPLDISIQNAPVLIAIEGIGGMGKTTLANLVCNDGKVKNYFTHIWFSCLSNTPDEIDVLRKIYQVVCEGSYSDLSMSQLEKKIKESIKDKTYLLVLDDVWEDDRGRWINIKSLLRSGANGSRIIVTTRLLSVVTGVGAVRAHNLKGLSKDDSWYLFKSLAFVSGDENDSERGRLGRKMLKRCRGLPLAIWCIGNLLYGKTIQEWREIEQVCLSIVDGGFDERIRSILKLSYDHLPAKLKWCFIYCCLFPKDYRYNKRELIYHWIAQGYISFNEEESSFMHLVRMGFFQEVEKDELGDIESCKMHDIMHDLALHLIGEEGEFGKSSNEDSRTRHVSLIVDGDEGGSWNIPPSLLKVKSIRSCMLRTLSYEHNQPSLDKLCSHFKLLRTLTLSGLSIEQIPASIGELTLLRYLDLSENKFRELPNSITNLLNLLVLNLEGCEKLQVWPRNFKKLMKLQFLKFEGEFSPMPEGIAGMDSLQYLNNFKVQNWSELDGLNKVLERVRGHLLILFDREVKVEDGGKWQLPTTISLQNLEIVSYPGHGIRGWAYSETEKLERLQLKSCENVNYLSPISCLKYLHLCDLPELEFIEEEEEVNTHNTGTSHKFFPSLKKLLMNDLPRLKGWRGTVAVEAASTSSNSGFPGEALASLEELEIERCSSITSLHLASPNLLKIDIDECDELLHIEVDQIKSLQYLKINNCRQLMSLHIEAIPGEPLASLEELYIYRCSSLTSLHLASLRLIKLSISGCNEIRSIELDQILSLRYLKIVNFEQQMILQIEAHLFAGLEEIQINGCSDQLTVMLLNLHDKKLSMSSLKDIHITNCKWATSLEFVELTSLQRCFLKDTVGLQSLHIPSPHLRKIHLRNCAGLTSVEVEAATDISIRCCFELKNFRIAEPDAVQELRITSLFSVDWGSISNLYECRCISNIYLDGVDGRFIQLLFSSSSSSLQEGEMPIFKSIASLTVALTSLVKFSIKNVHGLQTLIIKSPHLKSIHIFKCNMLTSVKLESPIAHSDGRVFIGQCTQLKNVRIPCPNALQKLNLTECPELSFNTGVDWDSLPDLNHLVLRPMPKLLPKCLLQLQAINNLLITERGWGMF